MALKHKVSVSTYLDPINLEKLKKIVKRSEMTMARYVAQLIVKHINETQLKEKKNV